MLRGRLAPPSQVHRWAAATLLEGLSLWCQTPLSVVLCVGDEGVSSGLHLSDGFGFGATTAFYDVKVVEDRGFGFANFQQLGKLSRWMAP